MNFVICGMPRSGTTIIARFIGGLAGVRVLHEPYQHAAKFGMFPPKFEHNGEEHFGFKEPFWGIEAGCQIRNDAILRVYQRMGWKFIWVIREPEAVWKSTKDFLPDVGKCDFILNADRFEEFARRWNRDTDSVIRYEDFCRDPVGTWNTTMPLPVRATEVNLQPIPDGDFVGDPKARESTSIIYA